MKNSLRFVLLMLLFFPLLASAQFSGPARGSEEGVNYPLEITTDPTILFPPSRDVRIQQGDLLAVTVLGATDYIPTDRVNTQGYIRLPLIGAVQVDGLTLHEAESSIASRMTSLQMFNNPQVTVTISDPTTHFATVIGEAHSVVPMTASKRLFDVLAAAGGLPVTASHVISISRPGINKPIVVDMGNDPSSSQMANVPIFSGDTITVPRVGNVYVIGAVHTQAAIPLVQNTPLTVAQAVAVSGGLPFEAKANETRIIRTVGHNRTIVTVHLRKVLAGLEPDPVLQSDDIVIVPSDKILAAVRGGGIGTLIGISSLVVSILYLSTR